MYKLVILLTSFIFCQPLKSQYQIILKGTVKTQSGIAIASANIIIEGTYIGSISDSSGKFTIQYAAIKDSIIVLRCEAIGYASQQLRLNLSQTDTIDSRFSLKQVFHELNAVTIMSSRFSTDRTDKSVSLSPVDILTTGASNADITAAIKTLPGVQQVGEQEGLFIRGGSNNETKYFINGMLVSTPFYGGAPNVAQRGRFSPFLFEGQSFNSGGYSTIYGDALTGVLTLTTKDMPLKSSAKLHLGSVLAEGGLQKINRKKNFSYGIEGNYINLSHYYNLIKQKYTFTQAPVMGSYTITSQYRTDKISLKLLHSGSFNKTALLKDNIDQEDQTDHLFYKGTNLFSILTGVYKLNKKQSIELGLGHNFFNEDKQSLSMNIDFSDTLRDARISKWKSMVQLRTVYNLKYKKSGHLKVGGEIFFDRNFYMLSTAPTKKSDNYTAIFAENSYNISSRFALNAGLRFEHSTAMHKFNSLLPRLSAAFKLSQNWSIGVTYGQFGQKNALEVLSLYKLNGFKWPKSSQYIVGGYYNTIGRALRIETYYYNFRNLLKYDSPYSATNEGKGFSNGLDFFYRDKTLISGFDFWISYSFINTKRNTINLPRSITPNYISPHTASVATKYYINKLSLQLNTTYTVSAGRNYYNIDYANSRYHILDIGKTKTFHNVGFSANYFFGLKKIYGILVASCTNVLGQDPIFGYEYSSYNPNRPIFKTPIKLQATRFYFLGVLLNWGVDSRQDEINKMLNEN